MSQPRPPAYHLRYVVAHLPDQFNAVAFSPKGGVLASGSADHQVRLYSAASGELLQSLNGHESVVRSVAWSPDARLLASGSDDQTVRIWEVASGRLLHTLQGHGSGVTSVAWRDNKVLASGSDDNKVRTWQAKSGMLLRAMNGHVHRVNSIAWSPDGKVLASGSDDETVHMWEAASGRLLRTLQGGGAVSSIAWSPDGKVLASGSEDCMVHMWEAASGKLLRTLARHRNLVSSLAWSPNGKVLVSGCVDNTVRMWEAASGRLLRTLDGHGGAVCSVAWSPEGTVLASGSEDRTVRLWEAPSGKLLRSLQGHGEWLRSVAWSPDGSVLASGSADHTVRMWEVATGKLLQTLQGHAHWVRSVAWSPDGKVLASGSEDTTVRLWAVASGVLLHTLSGHEGRVSSVAWSPDGAALASGSSDKTVRIWEVATGKLLRTLQGHADWVRTATWSPDGLALASGSDDHTVRIWSTASGQLLHTLQGHGNGVSSVAWSPDGKVLASGSDDAEVRTWAVASGSLLRTLEGHGHWVSSVTWSPDGTILVSVSGDNTARLWDPHNGYCLAACPLGRSGYSFVDATVVATEPVTAAVGKTCLGDPDLIVTAIPIGLRERLPAPPSTRIVCAKIVLMGESGVGKSGLALRLAERRFEPQVSTHGMRLWPLAYDQLDTSGAIPAGEQRDIVLWDLGGQAEYRLVHQLFLHDTTLALMLLDPTRDSHFHDVDQWNQRLQKQLRGQPIGKLLVGTQADVIDRQLIDPVRVADTVRKWQMQGYHLTSAKDDTGIAALRAQLAELIDWNALSTTTRPLLWQRIHDLINQRRQQGQIVVLYSALEKELQAVLADEYDGEALRIVVGQLARQGVITDTRLATGQRALLLRIDYVEIYAGSLIRLAREAASQSGVPALEVLDAIIRNAYPGISATDRIPDPLTERSVLECVIELMIEHGICLKHERLLIFPVLFPEATAADREQAQHSVSLYYDFSGAIDNIYSALVAQLAVSERFGRVRLWKDRAEFERAGQGVCALRRRDRPGGWSHVDLLFSDKTAPATRDLFTAVVEAHLQKEGVTIREVLEMDCPQCAFRFEEALLRARIEAGKLDIICPRCETRAAINSGAKKDDPQVAPALTALRKIIEDRKHRDIADTKRELGATHAFISYADADEAMCEKLLTHLSTLQRKGLIHTWYDRQVSAGAEWEEERDRNLSRASIVLLLISADYIASDYCYQTEMQRALSRHAAGQARVIPVLVRPVEGWQSMAFGQLRALPTNGQPVSAWYDEDAAFADITAGVQRAVAELMRPSAATAPRTLVTTSPRLQRIEPTPIRILHLSDLHFGPGDDPYVQLQPLLRDIREGDGLGFTKIDYLVISGDLTQRATAEEFESAYKFISLLIEELELSAARVVMTPGNHDLSWEQQVYQWQPKRKVDVNKLRAGTYVAQGDGNLVRDEASYPKRWDNFARFYHQLTQHPYATRPEAQCRAMLFDELRVQFLEINSSWEIDEYFRDRSGINPAALASGLLQANKQLASARSEGRIARDAAVFRIVVWHHPLTGNEKMQHDAFVDQLRQEKFQLALHGHVHEDRADVVSYLHPRKLYVAGAGSFGARHEDRPESTPRLYNVLELARDHSKVVVHTRCLRKEGGAWEGWAAWPDADPTRRRTFYELRFPKEGSGGSG